MCSLVFKPKALVVQCMTMLPTNLFRISPNHSCCCAALIKADGKDIVKRSTVRKNRSEGVTQTQMLVLLMSTSDQCRTCVGPGTS